LVTGIRGPDQPNDGFLRPQQLRVERQELACDRLMANALGLPLEAWRREGGGYLAAFNRLSSTQRASLERRFGESALQEILSLGGEKDLAILAESLFNLGERLENSERLAAAAALFSSLASLPPELPTRDRAERRLDAIAGRGDAAARSEFLFRRTLDQASDLSNLVAMFVAGGVFQRVRLGLSCNLANQNAGLFTRGVGARILANGGALLIEAPSFSLSASATRNLLNPEVSQDSLGRSTLSALLTLSGLRLMGGLSGLALRNWGDGNGLGQGVLRSLLPQVGMYSGIVLGRQLEEYAGLRPRQSGATLFTDSLATLLQFHVAGRLNQEFFASGESAQNQTFELLHAELRGRDLRFPCGETGLSLVAAGPATSARGALPEVRPPFQEILAVMITGGRGRGSEPPRRGSPPLPENPGEAPAPEPKVVSLEEYRRQRSATKGDRTTPVPDDPDDRQPRLITQFSQASDPEHWMEQLRLSMMNWYANQPPRLFRRDFATIHSRLRVAPDSVVKLLGYYSVRRPQTAQGLLIELGILPSESPLYLQYSGQRAYEWANATELRDFGDHTWSHFNVAIRQLAGREASAPTINEERVWRNRLKTLSPASVEVLRDPLLSDSQLLYLTYYLNLQYLGYLR